MIDAIKKQNGSDIWILFSNWLPYSFSLVCLKWTATGLKQIVHANQDCHDGCRQTWRTQVQKCKYVVCTAVSCAETWLHWIPMTSLKPRSKQKLKHWATSSLAPSWNWLGGDDKEEHSAHFTGKVQKARGMCTDTSNHSANKPLPLFSLYSICCLCPHTHTHARTHTRTQTMSCLWGYYLGVSSGQSWVHRATLKPYLLRRQSLVCSPISIFLPPLTSVPIRRKIKG